MNKKQTDSGRKLALKRETLRALQVLGPDELLHVGGGGSARMPPSLSTGSKYC